MVVKDNSQTKITSELHAYNCSGLDQSKSKIYRESGLSKMLTILKRINNLNTSTQATSCLLIML